MQAEKQLITNKTLENMVLKLAEESPELNDLNIEQLEQIAKIVITQNLTNEMSDKVKLAKIDYKKEKTIFIMQSSRTGSDYTQTCYYKAIRKLEKYTEKFGYNILQLTAKQADDFIYSLSGSPNSKNLVIAGISSFYSYLERRYTVIKNPFRGTKARPVKKAVREIEVPNEIELFTILNNLPELEKMAVSVMAYRGLRVGALQKLNIWGCKYQSVSKGKMIYGEFPVEVVVNIKGSDLNNRSPFNRYSTNALKLRVYRQTQKLHKEGKIQAAYSAHDFRHFFAVQEYLKDKDIYRVSKLLDHNNISITEGYLKSLKVEI